MDRDAHRIGDGFILQVHHPRQELHDIVAREAALVVFGASMLMKLMERWPVIITIGAGLLGWTALDMAITDAIVAPYIHGSPQIMHLAIPALGAIFVIATGKWFALRHR